MLGLPIFSYHDENHDALQQSFNDLANLSRITDILYGEHGQFEWQMDFFRIIYLIFQTAFSPDEKLRNESNLINRFVNRFGRKPPETMISSLLSRMQQIGWMYKSPEGLMITELGVRMSSFLFDILNQNFLFHQKDDLEKAVFLSQLSGMKFELLQKMDMENEPEFLTLLYSIQNLSIQVRKNIPIYIQKNTALDEILKLKELMEKSINIAEDYINSETIIEKIDNFRLKYHYFNGVLQDALSVCHEGLGEVIKAIEIASSEVVFSPISHERFLSALTSKLKEEFMKTSSEVKSVYEIILEMDAEKNEQPLAYIPEKIFGGISEQDIRQTIEAVGRGGITFGTAVQRRSLFDDDFLQDVPEPLRLDLEEIRQLEMSEVFLDKEDHYDKTFQEILNFVAENEEKENTVQDWILSLATPKRFQAAVFLDFLTYMQKLGLVHIDLEQRRTPRLHPFGWHFVAFRDNKSWSLTGHEVIKFPQRKLLEVYDRLHYQKFLKKDEEVHEQSLSNP